MTLLPAWEAMQSALKAYDAAPNDAHWAAFLALRNHYGASEIPGEAEASTDFMAALDDASAARGYW